MEPGRGPKGAKKRPGGAKKRPGGCQEEAWRSLEGAKNEPGMSLLQNALSWFNFQLEVKPGESSGLTSNWKLNQDILLV